MMNQIMRTVCIGLTNSCWQAVARTAPYPLVANWAVARTAPYPLRYFYLNGIGGVSPCMPLPYSHTFSFYRMLTHKVAQLIDFCKTKKFRSLHAIMLCHL